MGSALVRFAAALLLAGNQQCAEVYAAVHADDDTAIATFARAGFEELVTHADLPKGPRRDRLPQAAGRRRRPTAAPKPPPPPNPKPKAEVVPVAARVRARGH